MFYLPKELTSKVVTSHKIKLKVNTYTKQMLDDLLSWKGTGQDITDFEETQKIKFEKFYDEQLDKQEVI